ncbi:MAG: hypothetical protein WEB52_03135 [Dehalococcoidia bacterium]
MTLGKHLFNRRVKETAPSLRGVAREETEAAQREMRTHMEADVAADRERRGATDVRPGSGTAREDKQDQP